MKTKKSKHSDNKINMYYEQEFQLEQDRLNFSYFFTFSILTHI